MRILEQTVIPKNPAKKSEDGIVVANDFIAVIDGSTSKASRRYSLFASNGRYAMQVVARCLRRAKGTITLHQFCKEASAAIARHYRKRDLPQLAEHPEERLTASAVIFSRLNREIWMVGDCQCLIDGTLFDNPKPYEAELAQLRADHIRQSPQPWDHFLDDDTARQAMIPRMKETMRQQNVTYSVIDGFPIPMQHVRLIPLDFHPHTIVLASDGYPVLRPTLLESEAELARIRREDPLNISLFPATKGFMNGFNSFDDRSYIRFEV